LSYCRIPINAHTRGAKLQELASDPLLTIR
jgi:hypothetical protein